ncbi:MAG: HAD family phosphatase [Candidatus Krumholzibacteriota bacterium]|nr:HAD family phosphatase [Candidatus Krumholzibacteriota bacterium]
MPRSETISTVIFDLGGVLLLFDHRTICRRLERRYGIDEDLAYRKIFQSGLEAQFDEGKLTPEQFVVACSAELDRPLDIVEFKNLWADIFRENRPVVELIPRLAEKSTLLLLSNTNAWHMELIKSKFPVIALFDSLVLSYTVGHRKPHRKIFERALRESEDPSRPGRSLFIDDLEENVRAAEALGLSTLLYRTPAALKKKLIQLYLI